jgi:hypothetical protein
MLWMCAAAKLILGELQQHMTTPSNMSALQAASRATLDALVTAGRVCRAARLTGDAQAQGRSSGCSAAAEFDAAARGVPAAADAAAATDFDSAAAAVAAADAFGARMESTAVASASTNKQLSAQTAATTSAETGSAATCCRLPSPSANSNADECMSPPKPVAFGAAAEQAALWYHQSAPPPPLAALPQPEGHNWCVETNHMIITLLRFCLSVPHMQAASSRTCW